MRIVLADRQQRVLRALGLLLGSQPGWEIVAQASTADELARLLSGAHADLLLLDWELGAHAALPRVGGSPCVIALSGRPEVRAEALAAGADEFVSKGDPPEQLLAAVRRCEQHLEV